MKRRTIIRELDRLAALNATYAAERPNVVDPAGAEASGRAFAYRYAADLLAGSREIRPLHDEADEEAANEVPMYVVFDGPPAHNSGRFVEVEDEHGHSVGPEGSGADWIQRRGFWLLGPFRRAPKPSDEKAEGQARA